MLIVILVVGWMSIVVDALKYLCLSFFVYYMCFSIFIVCYFNLLLHSFARNFILLGGGIHFKVLDNLSLIKVSTIFKP